MAATSATGAFLALAAFAAVLALAATLSQSLRRLTSPLPEGVSS